MTTKVHQFFSSKDGRFSLANEELMLFISNFTILKKAIKNFLIKTQKTGDNFLSKKN